MTFYTVGPADMLASRLMDLDVHNLQNEEIGEIDDLIIDEGKNIRGVIISIGGFLGIGERRVAIQPGSLIITREGTDDLKAVVNTTKEELQNAQEFKFEGSLSRK
jgi:sporulation protein YlmC with PRC-barrel domain